MTAAIYARVSKEQQHTDNQIPELLAFCQRNGWEPVEYVEKASAKEGGKRPVLSQLLQDARKKKFDVVVVWKIDRFGRSLGDFVANVNALDSAGVRFCAPAQSIDTDKKSPLSKMLMHLLAIFAEFERDLIVDRVNLGLTEYRRAYSKGEVGLGEGKTRQSKSGLNKAIGRPKVTFHRGRAADMRKAGISWRQIAKVLGVKVSTVRLAVQQFNEIGK